MSKNNKTLVTSIDITHYDTPTGVYTLSYYLSVRAGVMRKRIATYSRSEGLSKDSENKDLIKKIEQEIQLLNKTLRSHSSIK